MIFLMAGLTATSACEAVAAQSASAREGEDQWDPANWDFWISIEKPLNLGQGLQFVAEEEIEFGQPLLRTEDPQTRMVP